MGLLIIIEVPIIGEGFVLIGFHIKQSWRALSDEASDMAIFGFKFREYTPVLMDPCV